MKATLLKETHGLAAGTEIKVIHKGPEVVTFETANAGTAVVANADVRFEEEAPTAAASEPVERLAVHDDIEAEARLMYDDYTAATGGIAFNGDALPPASEFFEDPAKQKQANAWRTVAGLALDRFYGVASSAPAAEPLSDPKPDATEPGGPIDEVKDSEEAERTAEEAERTAEEAERTAEEAERTAEDEADAQEPNPDLDEANKDL